MEWAVIKGVSGFAGSEDMTEPWQIFASTMAASVVYNMLKYPVVLEDWPHNETQDVKGSYSLLLNYKCLAFFTVNNGSGIRTQMKRFHILGNKPIIFGKVLIKIYIVTFTLLFQMGNRGLLQRHRLVVLQGLKQQSSLKQVFHRQLDFV